jgi:chaperonin cofactor prefoldin
MHKVLLSTSSRSIATNALTRLATFTSDPSSIEQARLRVQEADRAFQQRMSHLYAAFTAMMKQVSNNASEDLTFTRMEEIKVRILRLEDEYSTRGRSRQRTAQAPDGTPPPPPPTDPGSTRHPDPKSTKPSVMHPVTSPLEEEEEVEEVERPVDGEETAANKAEDMDVDGKPEDQPGIPGKRDRARTLLENLIGRLEVIEQHKQDLDDRMQDLESARDEIVGENMEKVNIGWGDLEDERDPDRRLRGPLPGGEATSDTQAEMKTLKEEMEMYKQIAIGAALRAEESVKALEQIKAEREARDLEIVRTMVKSMHMEIARIADEVS